MNDPKFLNMNSIESIEFSIQTLIKNWYTRQKWHTFFKSRNQETPNPNKSQWRIHLSNFLESTEIHAISLFLLFLDLIFTTLELSSSIISCTREKPKTHEEKSELYYFHWVGITILTILCAKMIGLVVGLGGAFFRRPGYVVDAIVLAAAVVLEVVLEGKGGGFVVVVSLWRIVRVVESVFELSDERIEEQIEGILVQFDGLKEENSRLLMIINDKNFIIQKIQQELDQCNQSCIDISL